MNEEELIQFLEDNLSIQIEQPLFGGGYKTEATYCVKLMLGDKVISRDSFTVTTE